VSEIEVKMANEINEFKRRIAKLTEENLRFQHGEETQQRKYLELIRRFSEMNEEFVNSKLKAELQLKNELE